MIALLAGIFARTINPDAELARQHLRADDPNRAILFAAEWYYKAGIPLLTVLALLAALLAVHNAKKKPPRVSLARGCVTASFVLSAFLFIVWLWLSSEAEKLI